MVAKVVRADPRFQADSVFVTITLREPPKAVLREFEAGGGRPPRGADVVLYDRAARVVIEVVVSLPELRVVLWRGVDGARPKTARREFEAAVAAVKSHPGWQEALRKRGVEDFEFVEVQPWPPGYADEGDHRSGARGGQGLGLGGVFEVRQHVCPARRGPGGDRRS